MTETHQQKELWVNYYAPQVYYELRGNRDNVKRAIEFINTYASSRPNRKYLLLSGPPGSGKTLLANSIANACNIELLKVNCSIGVQQIKELIMPYLVVGKVLILLDEFDVLNSKKPEIYSFLSKVIKVTVNPIILTCNNISKIPSNFVEKQCIVLKFMRPSDSTIRNELIEIATKEGMKLTTEELDKLIIKGDFRASINALQIYNMSGFILPQIQRDKNLFTETQSALSKKTAIDEKAVPDANLEYMLAWIEENGYSQLTGIDRHHFYQTLNHISKLIAKHRYDEARHLLGMISYCMKPGQDSIKLQKPAFQKHINSTLNSLALKICKDYSMSSIEFLDFVFPIMQKYAIVDVDYARHIATKYSLNKEEVALLLDTKVGDPRIIKVLKPDTALTKKKSQSS